MRCKSTSSNHNESLSVKLKVSWGESNSARVLEHDEDNLTLAKFQGSRRADACTPTTVVYPHFRVLCNSIAFN